MSHHDAARERSHGSQCVTIAKAPLRAAAPTTTARIITAVSREPWFQSARYTLDRPMPSVFAMSVGRIPVAFNSRTLASSIEAGRPL
jgi:hypothetical protein